MKFRKMLKEFDSSKTMEDFKKVFDNIIKANPELKKFENQFRFVYFQGLNKGAELAYKDFSANKQINLNSPDKNYKPTYSAGIPEK